MPGLERAGPVTEAEAREAFERLKTLAGSWVGPAVDAATGEVHLERSRVTYRLTGAGSALTELANVATPDEMLSVFFVDRDRLLLQHYCTVDNQPLLELVEAGPGRLLFDLVGGRNLDPSVDGHIHRVRIAFPADGRLETLWSWFEAGEEDHVSRRVLRRRR